MINYWAGAVMVFAMMWWFVFFMLLPVGVRTAETPEEGHAPSAPENPNLWKKALITTILAFLITWIIMHMVEAGVMSFRPAAADSAL